MLQYVNKYTFIKVDILQLLFYNQLLGLILMESRKMARRRGPPLLERKTTFARYLTKARSEAKLTQDMAGKKIGKDKAFICRLERSSKTPPPHVIRALAGIYDIPPDKLLKKAGYKELPLLDVIKRPESSPDMILDNVTADEKRELKRYLAFMRIVNS